MPRKYTPEEMEAAFWSKVDASGDCWEWTGNKAAGYGKFKVQRRQSNAHRVAYELLVGPIPLGLTIDHLCRNHACVNPDHLQPVTQRENLRRGYGGNVHNARKARCPQGHPYDEANTFLSKGRNHRRCRTCVNTWNKLYMRRRRANLAAARS